MKYFIFLLVAGFAGLAWADDAPPEETQSTDLSSEFGQGGTSTQAEEKMSSKKEHHEEKAKSSHRRRDCSPERLGEEAKKGSKWLVTHLKCRVAVRSALKRAGCNVPLGGPQSYSVLAKHGWRCGRSSPRNAPEGAIIMTQRGSNDRHYEIKHHGCYYSDFHLLDCRPATEYSRPFRMIGWCAP